ncbi:DUF5302 domain-containing protein [Streptomyces sp. NBC_00158]|uniref:DUF5302 domain-containing protein n=1 Tax=Streptomyces sp. NBC_00158 TaxID=2903627 RepID=UPI002F9066D3
MSDTPQNEAAEPAEPAEAVEPDDKARFREALERKASATRSQQAHNAGGLKLKGGSGPSGQGRTFRRKAG